MTENLPEIDVDVKFQGHPIVSFFIQKDGKPKVTLYLTGVLILAGWVFQTFILPML